MTGRRPLGLLLCLPLLLLPSCGGQRENDVIRDVTADYLGAIADGEAQAACDLLTPESREATGCEGNDELRGDLRPTEEQIDAVGDAPVTIRGDRGTVAADGSTYVLRKTGDEWRISLE